MSYSSPVCMIGRQHGACLAIVLILAALGLGQTGVSRATSWETTSLRTPGGGLVRPGMTRQEVLQALEQTEDARTAARKPDRGISTGRKKSSISYRSADGLYSIQFSGDRVVRIVVTPRRD